MLAKSRRGSRGEYSWNCCARHYDLGAHGYKPQQNQMTTRKRQAAFGLLSMVANKGQI